ncbi:MAG: helix-turn-helix domain-containing protein [Bdellovibrionota bacterium]
MRLKRKSQKNSAEKPSPKAAHKSPKKHSSTLRTSVESWLQLAQLRCEKCELKEAQVAYGMGLEIARKRSDLRGMMEALSGLLRLAGEAQESEAVDKLAAELDRLMTRHPTQVPPMAWYCKATIARHYNEPKMAQRYLRKYLASLAEEPTPENPAEKRVRDEAVAKGYALHAITLWQRGLPKRSIFLADILLKHYEHEKFRGINGMLYLLRGNIAEWQRDYPTALSWYQKAHGSFLGEHNWYYHLYVLYGYARLARLQQNYTQAYWYLDLLDKAASGPEFGLLRREILAERTRLQQEAVDLLIDSRKCLVKTRDGGAISLRKQYVLLAILEALSVAHNRMGEEGERGLSKAEIIQQVWKENYLPVAHDNKLYYNINRLRKLIEPDVRKPQYLLNWKEGYRLAPGLRVQRLGTRDLTGEDWKIG